MGTLGHARSVLGDVRRGARAQLGWGRGVRPGERGCSCPTHSLGTERTISASVCLCSPLRAQGSPQACGSWPGCSLRVLTPEGHQGTELGVPWSQGQLGERSQNTAETSEHLPGWLGVGLWAAEGLGAVPRPENTSERGIREAVPVAEGFWCPEV